MFTDRREAGRFLGGHSSITAARTRSCSDCRVVACPSLPKSPEFSMRRLMCGSCASSESHLSPSSGWERSQKARPPFSIVRSCSRSTSRSRARRGRPPRDGRGPPSSRALSRRSADADLHGQIVILVDDGIATGGTMRAAVRAVKKQRPAHLVVAAPVATPGTVESATRRGRRGRVRSHAHQSLRDRPLVRGLPAGPRRAGRSPARGGPRMANRPLILIVDDRPRGLSALLEAIARRYGGDYQSSPTSPPAPRSRISRVPRRQATTSRSSSPTSGCRR